jgi:hypothetical protein
VAVVVSGPAVVEVADEVEIAVATGAAAAKAAVVDVAETAAVAGDAGRYLSLALALELKTRDFFSRGELPQLALCF